MKVTCYKWQPEFRFTFMVRRMVTQLDKLLGWEITVFNYEIRVSMSRRQGDENNN